jgi:hypothetical protein
MKRRCKRSILLIDKQSHINSRLKIICSKIRNCSWSTALCVSYCDIFIFSRWPFPPFKQVRPTFVGQNLEFHTKFPFCNCSLVGSGPTPKSGPRYGLPSVCDSPVTPKVLACDHCFFFAFSCSCIKFSVFVSSLCFPFVTSLLSLSECLIRK